VRRVPHRGEPIASARRWNEVEHATPVAPEHDPRALAARVRDRILAVEVAELRCGGFAVIVGDA